MKVLISPDKFKGSLSASELCELIASVLTKHGIEVIQHPLADGGDGSLELLKNYLSLESIDINVFDPLGREISATYLYSENEAFVELASASGHVLLDNNERNPMKTSTRGTGQMIRHAINNGANTVNLFLGGSATNDAGMGILHELGFRFLDQHNSTLFPSGENLIKLASISTEGARDFKNISFNLICDVNNPLYGPRGAAEVYAKQKGASERDVKFLDDGLKNFANCIYKHSGVDVQIVEGAGAAGGIPGGLIPLLNASRKFGAKHFMALTGYENHLSGVDAVITGEGCLDGQSFNGKVVDYVQQASKRKALPLFFFVGMCKYDEVPDLKKDHVFAVLDVAKDSLDSMNNVRKHITALTNDFVEFLEMHPVNTQ